MPPANRAPVGCAVRGFRAPDTHEQRHPRCTVIRLRQGYGGHVHDG